uniref:VWFA domain-containing protein n=1 Tax=Anisakis simplex TaxID=6269 RepID=A0A0M3KHD1_ANISI
LPELDPWDPWIMKFISPNVGKKCKVAAKKIYTELQNGTLRSVIKDNDQADALVSGSVECKYRCMSSKREESVEGGEWINIDNNQTYRVKCDFIETQCFVNKRLTYNNLHIQVVRPEGVKFVNEGPENPSVIIFIFDSTSSSTGFRSLPQTQQILRQFYDAVPFYHNNKVGLNSRPNAFGIFAGRTEQI